MGVDTLPECRWRGLEMAPGHYQCHSPKIVVGPTGVTANVCNECYCRNHSPLCDCVRDGFCHRYQREMGGRFREICAGVNVDLGTAAAFRAQWAREAGGKVPEVSKPPRPIILHTNQNPGDTVAMTAALYSLHKAHPGRYLTAVESPYPEVFLYNPYVTPPVAGADVIQMHYPAIHQSNDRAVHFMQGWCEHLSGALGVHVPLLTNRPHLYFNTIIPQENYWIICSGGKQDFTNKLWGRANYQAVVRYLHNKVKFVQVGLQMKDHPPLDGVEDRVGETNLRELFDLVRSARGVLCGVSLLMHVAAALEKPAIVVAGGREPVQWNAYPKQQYVHTVGILPCTDVQGRVGNACWRSRVVQLGDGTVFDKDPCERPVDGMPQCMRMINPALVTELILRIQNGV